MGLRKKRKMMEFYIEHYGLVAGLDKFNEWESDWEDHRRGKTNKILSIIQNIVRLGR